jgi:microcystin-dependent protein
MTTGLLKSSNGLSELTGSLETAYTNIRLNTTLPIGIILPFTGATVPSGWALCYGQAISRTTYAGLFAVIGTTYGSGNGTTTFNVPDLRGRVVAGRDNMGGTAASRITSAVFGMSADALGANGGDESVGLSPLSGAEGYDNTPANAETISNIQPTMILNYIIKTDLVTEAVP